MLAIENGVLTLTATEQVHKTLVFWTHQGSVRNTAEICHSAPHKPFPIFKVRLYFNLVTYWTERHADLLLE
ncbi:hypothetical protein AFERRI_580042 [Acidithiobacillus ferrivorans]|uniref:Uncharacterized protein n=1 Tax=Acidithiobacillus ferrivorans TaxID=160808 RepID=A0A060UZ04_9PROT|nr:hypothetical protein AFERRI_580042 [Acidithiobacillus ferrivorans]